MATKTLMTRIQSKIATLAEWKLVESTFKPLRGEICIAEIPSGDNTATSSPTCLIKIGTGTDFFKDLTWLSARAADVQSFLKVDSEGNAWTQSSFEAWIKSLVTIEDVDTSAFALKTEVEAVSGVANKNKTDLAELTTTVSTLQSTHTTDKAALETSIATAKKAGDDAQSDLNVYKTSNDAAVAQALTDAKAYTDTLANGTVKTNTENIGKNTTAIATLRTDIQNGESIDSFADVETELAKYQLAGDYATKAEAQGYANAKDGAIAEAKKAGTDANAALEAYKTSNNEVVSGHTTAIAELETAIGNLGTNAGETYETKTDAAQKLKDAKDYTDALANDAVAKNTAAIATLNGNDEGSVNKKIADAINEFATTATDNKTIDTFKELVEYVGTHGGEAAEMASAIDALETKVGNETVEKQISDAITEANLGQYAKDSDLDALAKTVSDMDTAYKAKDTEITTELAKKATAEDLGKATTRIGTLETEMDTAEGKIKALEDVGSEKNVIVSVKVNGAALTPDANRAVNVTVPTGALASKNTVAKSDLATALASELDAKATEADLTLAEGRIAQNETDIDDLQAAKHTHSNKALLDTYTQTEANLADAVAKKHEHGNKSVIDGITAENVTTWNTVTSKASQSDLTSATNRVTALEDRIGFDGDVLIFDCGSSTVNV